jgi:hypothetical protein
MYTFGSSLVTTENKAVAGARELMVSRQAVGRSSRKHVDPSRVARRCGIGAVAAACAAVRCAFWLCSASVRWWTEARTTALAANSEQFSRWNTTATMGGFGDCERTAAISQAAREPHKTNRQRVGSRVLGDRKRAIPKREEGTGASHDPSSLVPQRTRDAFGCASLRGVDRPWPHARKRPSRHVRNVSLCPSRAHQRQADGLRKFSSLTGAIKQPKADEFLAKSRANSGAHPPEKETRFSRGFRRVQGDGSLLLRLRSSVFRRSLPDRARVGITPAS